MYPQRDSLLLQKRHSQPAPGIGSITQPPQLPPQLLQVRPLLLYFFHRSLQSMPTWPFIFMFVLRADFLMGRTVPFILVPSLEKQHAC